MSSNSRSPYPYLPSHPRPLTSFLSPPQRQRQQQQQQEDLAGLQQKDLRQQLENLGIETQSLQNSQAQLEAQLESVRNRITANNSAIQVMMKQVDQQAFLDQRAERQSAFRATVLGSDNLVEALRRKAREDAGWKSALLAIVSNRATHDDHNLVGATVMTELSGDVLSFLRDVAAQVLECDDDIERAMVEVETVDDSETATPTLTDEPQGQQPRSSRRSLSVKSEASSVKALSCIQQPTSSTRLDTAVAHARREQEALADTQNHPFPRIRPTPPQARLQTHVGHAANGSGAPDFAGLSRVETAIPGLLDSIRIGQEMLGLGKPAGAKGKRGRESVESEASGAATPATNPTKQVKKARLEKEPAYTPTFAAFIKQLETMHRQGNPITDVLKCSRCQQTKAKCRILNCMHLYCHKCVLNLRSEAEKGNAVTGFRAFCVKPGCLTEVSGKTSVVESEAMAFLKWYDEQPAGLTSTTAKLHVLNDALEEFPDDFEIKRKLSLVHGQINQLRLNRKDDVPCDLLELVKLARKPY